MRRTRAISLLLVLGLGIANTGCGDGAPALVAIEIEPAAPSLELGEERPLVALGVLANGHEIDLSGQVEWSSSAAEVASVDGAGRAIGLAPGDTTVTARFGQTEGSIVVTVLPAAVVSLTVETASGEPSSVTMGQTLELVAVATLSDDSTEDVTESVTWSSEEEATATVEPGTGAVTGVGAGTTDIVASLSSARGLITGRLTVTVISPNLVIPAGEHSFDTDTGELTLEGQPPEVVTGWDAEARRLALVDFTLEAGAELTLTGAAPFHVEAEGDIRIDGTLDGSGADGTDGAAGAEDVPAEAGSDGSPGKDVILEALGTLSFTGVIDLRGGDGGFGGEVSVTNPSGTLLSGDGGNGGDAGTLTVSAGEAPAMSGTVLRRGGNGGDGGRITITEVLLTPSPTTSGRGGAGGAGEDGGAGGSGGDISISDIVNTPNTVVAGRGGNGGPGTLRGGPGGRGGSLSVGNRANSGVVMTAGDGGSGGDGGAEGGTGGDGGNISVVDDNDGIATAGEGGNGGDGDARGGDGGNGGSVEVGRGNAGTGGFGGDGGQPGGSPGTPGDP